MSKPWDNEPTPWTDAADDDIDPYMPIDMARLMEQRMRAAERLLEDKMCGRECKCCKEAKAHLDAALKKDGQ